MQDPKYAIAILGAGNGGQAFASYLSSKGHSIRLWNRSTDKLLSLSAAKEIVLEGAIALTARIDVVTDSLYDAIHKAEIILVTTTADAHFDLARALAPILEENQIIVLNPGRTGGALEFRHTITRFGCRKRVYVAEAQSLVYACRLVNPGRVRIIGAKEHVPLAAFPASDTAHVLSHVESLFNCFVPAPHVLYTSLENIGAIFHPAIVMFNAATIERGQGFYFYQDMTDSVANFLVTLDRERLALGKAFGMALSPIFDWLKIAYPDCDGATLTERMQVNPAYREIKAPTQLSSRLLLEDIPTGLVPFVALSQVVDLDMSLTRSVIHVTSSLLGRDFWNVGRNLEKLGIAGMTPSEMLAYIMQ
ncbi:MAG: Opine dehydrogenase [Chloroflexi bacterium ADurb.Bin360]|nr:MAG: Opine dehydrogenase [Chloroflexi bacterium ADurb.Bin360]